jgi:DNA-directed RNA polymerase subunit RPC12/RpoP
LNVKPSSFDIHVGYTCPNCNHEHHLFLEDVRTRTNIVCPQCNVTYRIDAVDTVEFTPKFKTKPKLESQLSQTDLERAYKVLLSMEYSAKEVKMAMIEAGKVGRPKDSKELVRKAICLLDTKT